MITHNKYASTVDSPAAPLPAGGTRPQTLIPVLDISLPVSKLSHFLRSLVGQNL
jgi:hypothetical protein